MALTNAEETWVSKEKKRVDFQAQIKVLNDTAITEMGTKRAEITAIQIKLASDAKAIQDQIDAL